nr:hypothetical protein [Tanacetum cinerariifolium]
MVRYVIIISALSRLLKGSVDPTLFIRRNDNDLLLLDEDKEGKAVEPSHYHGMIGTLLYLTASRPDLQFAICMCARAFQVTADVLEIYMHEFWATAKLHHNSIHFKMDTKKSVLDLEAFREMLHISPRIPSQSFAKLPSEEEILEFLMYLGHSHEIRHLTDVEHKNQKRSNEMYYPRFTKVIIDYFMTRKPSIFRRNRINSHYVREDVLFSKIKVVSRHQTTQQYGAILPIELTTNDIRNSKAYKEYDACTTGEAAPKPKASTKKKKGDSASFTTPPTLTPTTIVVAAPRLSATAKEEQTRDTHLSSTDEGTCSRPRVPDVPSDDSEEELSWNSSDDEEGDEQTKGRQESEGDKTDESNDGSDDDNDDDNDETVKAGSESDKDDDD